MHIIGIHDRLKYALVSSFNSLFRSLSYNAHMHVFLAVAKLVTRDHFVTPIEANTTDLIEVIMNDLNPPN